MSKLKNKKLWVAIFAQIVSILLLTKVISFDNGELITNVVASLLQILVLLGIFNNPDMEV